MGFYEVKPGIIEARRMPKTPDARKTKSAMEIYDWIKEYGYEYSCYTYLIKYDEVRTKLAEGRCGVTMDDYGRILIMTSGAELEVAPESWVIRFPNNQFTTMSDFDFQDNYNFLGNSAATFLPKMEAKN